MRLSHFRSLTMMILLAAGVALAGCGNDISPGNSSRKEGKTFKAPVAEAKLTQQPLIYEAVATITARTASTLSSKLMGTVRAVNVREGDVVKKGDLLVVVDQRQVSAQLDKARAGLKEALQAASSAESAREAARAAARLAKTTYQRYLKLLKENSVSQQEFDEVEARHRQAQASLAQAEAMVDAARHRVQEAQAAVEAATVSKKDAYIRAPYDGRITAKMISVGDLASPGTPFLTIERKGLYCADLVLPERHIQAVRIGDKVEVIIPAMGNLKVTGTIGRIIPLADPGSRSFQVKVALPEGLDLKSGMFARVKIPVGGAGKLLIPKTAIVREGQLTGIYIVDQKGRVHFRLVRLGKQYGNQVEVISGLKPGQRYLRMVPAGLEDGDQVEVSA